MSLSNAIERRQCIPIIYTRGTHYEVGYDVGRTFASIIQGFVELSTILNEEFLPAYNTSEGRKAYDATLNCVKANFPQYVRELEGTAEGAKVPFHKLFLLHMDTLVLGANGKEGNTEPVGCSSICVNQKDQEILGHTEDASRECLNNFYLVSAHIIEDKPQGRWGVKEEKFTSLCYAGHLPGYTMSYNHHGLVFSINTLCAKFVYPGKTPRHFLTRALLSAENFVQAQDILSDLGCGAGDGCSINMTFIQERGERLFYNIEMAPAGEDKKSRLNILTASPGENILHCNTYLRITNIIQATGTMRDSSDTRLTTLKSFPEPMSKNDVVKMLGDTSHSTFKVFRESALEETLQTETIAVGIFDCIEKTWSIYPDNPKITPPLVLPIVLKSKN